MPFDDQFAGVLHLLRKRHNSSCFDHGHGAFSKFASAKLALDFKSAFGTSLFDQLAFDQFVFG
jgi:hypothetical protein